MKKIFITILVIIIFVIYAIFNQKTSSVQSVSAGENTTPSTSKGSTNQSLTKTATNGTYKNGVYTGYAADAYYGTIQVKAVIQNSKITDVQFLQYPHDQEESVQVNQMAMPNLTQEAIQSQSANVDVVSGATQSSQAFNESLASALQQAK